MKKELIVHIGLPKTGSSAIQTVLAQNRERLLAHDLDYLPISDYRTALSGRTSSGNGLALACSMLATNDLSWVERSDPRVQSSIQAVEASAATRVLLSSEFFSFSTEAGWRFLKDLAGRTGRDLRIIAGVRNPHDAISASVVQLIRNHGLTDISQQRIRKFFSNQKLLKYFAYFSQIQAHTGAEVRLISYDRARQSGQLMREFLAQIEIDARTITDGAMGLKANVTPSPEAVAFARDCNVRKISHPLINSLLQWYPSRAPWTMIPRELAEEIDQFFGEDHRKFLETFAAGPFFEAPNANYVDIESCDFRKSPPLRAASLILPLIRRRGSN